MYYTTQDCFANIQGASNVNNNNSPFQNYIHPPGDDHRWQTTNTPGFLIYKICK